MAEAAFEPKIPDFDAKQREILGKYIYALKDPDNNKIFYVGQGTNNRVFSHLSAAAKIDKNATLTAEEKDVLASLEKDAGETVTAPNDKVKKILDIWGRGKDVEYMIIAHGLPEDREPSVADMIESAVYNAVKHTEAGNQLTNKANPPHPAFLNQADVEALWIEDVDPSKIDGIVFIFPIHKALREGLNAYEATRYAWRVGRRFRNLKAYAVGVDGYVSKGSFVIDNDKWYDAPDIPGKYQFDKKEELSDTENATLKALANKNWGNIIQAIPSAEHFFRFGNYLVAEFSNSKVTIIRGAGAENNKILDL